MTVADQLTGWIALAHADGNQVATQPVQWFQIAHARGGTVAARVGRLPEGIDMVRAERGQGGVCVEQMTPKVLDMA
ncbi:hypothetical protein CS8_095870 [Cupriavidus sp. 8B]